MHLEEAVTATKQAAKPHAKRPRLPWALDLYRSDVVKKWVMAVTGIALLGYVLVHMIGNLHLYEGPEQINGYGEALRDLGGDLAPRSFLLWVLRTGLIAAFVLHIHAAWALTLSNRRARGAGYQSSRNYIAANYASRTMRWSGTIVLLFVVWHLLDLTAGTVNPDFVRGDIYGNVVASFERPLVAAFYIGANIALAFHIYHGAWSMFQSLGMNNPRFNLWRRYFAAGFAGVILVGNVSFPVLVMAGLVD